MDARLDEIIRWGKYVYWLTPLDKQKVQSLVSIIETLQLVTKETSSSLSKVTSELADCKLLLASTTDNLQQQLQTSKSEQAKLLQDIDKQARQLAVASDQHRLDQSHIADLSAQVAVLTAESESLLEKEKLLTHTCNLANSTLEATRTQCKETEQREQVLVLQVKELQEKVNILTTTLNEIPNKNLWFTRDAELISLRRALDLALQAVPDKLSICDQIGKGCILHTGCIVMEAKRALSSACANKLVARIQALEKIVSQSHPHSLDYKCVQCDTLRQAKVELAALDANN